MSDKIKWIEIEHEKIALRRRFYGWQIVYPFNNQDGTPNWKNRTELGGRAFTIKLIMLLIVLLLFFYIYNHDTSVCRESLSHLDRTCAIYSQINSSTGILNLTIPKLNFSYEQPT